MPEAQQAGGGNPNAFSLLWPDDTYDWKVAGPSVEPVSGFELVEQAGNASDFTTLTFSSAGLTFSINNTTGGTDDLTNDLRVYADAIKLYQIV